MADQLFYRYWGKASPHSDTEPCFHLLPYHCLDVAAVGWHLLDPDQKRCQTLAYQLGVDPRWLQQWFSFCLAIHDIGKFAVAFQGLVTGLSEDLIPNSSQKQYTQRHDSLGYLLWKDWLGRELFKGGWADRSPWRREGQGIVAIDPWLRTVTGHHGIPPDDLLSGCSRWFEAGDEQAACEYVLSLSEWLLPDLSPLKDRQLNERFKSLSWQLAGIAVLADWSGSDQSVFSYVRKPMALTTYWDKYALPGAEEATRKMQPEQIRVEPFSRVDALFPFIKEPTPLQHYAATVELPDTPQLMLLEDVTGAGKTEAALILASRMLSRGIVDGFYIGLPTMATANGMYSRLGECYRRLFSVECRPSLVLAHGARELSDRFTESVRLSSGSNDRCYEPGEDSASIYCSAWVADNRKKALLADVGVGTLDQALLAVLPARHQSLRLLGLKGKLLLVDEVHAYSPYMRQLLSTLLEQHARQGGSAILLSATTPQFMRQMFADAFRRGLSADPIKVEKTAYPLATQVHGEGAEEQPVATRDSVRRKLQVKLLPSTDAVAEHIRVALKKGQCVCWIRNTVADARSSWQTAITQGWTDPEKISLFHSRFAMCDRQRIEADVLVRFGKDSGPLERVGQLLIATQVVEQSLDLDFDFLVSDLAPIDLLIQRAGRLHRHSRDKDGKPLSGKDAEDQRTAPVFCILAPKPADNADEQWLKPELTGTQAVYSHVGQLWLTLHQLEQQQWLLKMPDAARELIEGVYSDVSQGLIPDALQRLSWDAEGEAQGEKGMARVNALKMEQGYCRASAEDSNGWDDDTRIPTRLSSDTVPVALVNLIDGELRPWAGEGEHRWALSQLSLPQGDWDKAQKLIPAELLPVIEQLKEKQRELRWVEVLPLVGSLSECYQPEGGWVLSKEER